MTRAEEIAARLNSKEWKERTANFYAAQDLDRQPEPLEELTIYFVQLGRSGPVKVGMTRNLAVRLQTLQTACHERLHVLASFPGSPELEQEIHALLSDSRLSGEWFNPDPQVLWTARTLKLTGGLEEPENLVRVTDSIPDSAVEHVARGTLLQREDSATTTTSSDSGSSDQLSSTVGTTE